MQFTLEELHKSVCSNINNVYEVFKEFFGEEYVDLQNLPTLDNIKRHLLQDTDSHFELSDNQLGVLKSSFLRESIRPFILVYWPEVQVTNEHNRSVTIQDLYAKIPLTIDGQIPFESEGFYLNRATYSAVQFLSGSDQRGYLHSHVRNIPKHNFSEFQHCCLGTGPIYNTICTLRTDQDETLWMLFCQELSLYVTVESLRGIPYNRLEEICITNISHAISYDYDGCLPGITVRNLLAPYIQEFIKYYLEHGHFKVDYSDHQFSSGMQDKEFLLDISDSFIKYFNLKKFSEYYYRSLLDNSVLLKVKQSDGKLYFIGSRGRGAIENYQGSHVCWFKGRDITLRIVGSIQNEPDNITILSPRIADFIKKSIFKIINYWYGRERVEGTSQTGERICCL